MEEKNEVRAVVDMRVSGKDQGGDQREMGGLRPKGYAGTADHPGECPGQNILEIKNSSGKRRRRRRRSKRPIDNVIYLQLLGDVSFSV